MRREHAKVIALTGVDELTVRRVANDQARARHHAHLDVAAANEGQEHHGISTCEWAGIRTRNEYELPNPSAARELVES